MDKLVQPNAWPVSERFVLWALRQWRYERTLPGNESTLHLGFERAGLLRLLPDFAIAMDAFLFGATRPIEINEPTCPGVSRDEATVVALCALAQGEFEGPLAASLDALMAPAASRAAAARLKVFATSLADAGLRLAPEPGPAAGRLH